MAVVSASSDAVLAPMLLVELLVSALLSLPTDTRGGGTSHRVPAADPHGRAEAEGTRDRDGSHQQTQQH